MKNTIIILNDENNYQDFLLKNKNLKNFYKLSKSFSVDKYYKIYLYDVFIYLFFSLVVPIIFSIILNLSTSDVFSILFSKIYEYLFQIIAQLILIGYFSFKYPRQMFRGKMMGVFLLYNIYIIFRIFINTIPFFKSDANANLVVLSVYWILVFIYLLYKNKLLKKMYIKFIENSFNIVLISITILFSLCVYFFFLFGWNQINSFFKVDNENINANIVNLLVPTFPELIRENNKALVTIVFFVVGVILVPVTHEICNKMILQNMLKNKFYSVFASSILYLLFLLNFSNSQTAIPIYNNNLIQMIKFFTPMIVISGCLYSNFKNIYPSIGFRFFLNLISFILFISVHLV